MFQYSLTNLGGVNFLSLRVRTRFLYVSVFSNESWWGELNHQRPIVYGRLVVSVFSNESWWGEQRCESGHGNVY